LEKCVLISIISPSLNLLFWRNVLFEQVTKTKKSSFTTLITTYPAMQNEYYSDEIQSEVTMDALFED